MLSSVKVTILVLIPKSQQRDHNQLGVLGQLPRTKKLPPDFIILCFYSFCHASQLIYIDPYVLMTLLYVRRADYISSQSHPASTAPERKHVALLPVLPSAKERTSRPLRTKMDLRRLGHNQHNMQADRLELDSTHADGRHPGLHYSPQSTYVSLRVVWQSSLSLKTLSLRQTTQVWRQDRPVPARADRMLLQRFHHLRVASAPSGRLLLYCREYRCTRAFHQLVTALTGGPK